MPFMNFNPNQNEKHLVFVKRIRMQMRILTKNDRKRGNYFGKENKLESHFLPASSAVFIFIGERMLQNGGKAGSVFL